MKPLSSAARTVDRAGAVCRHGVWTGWGWDGQRGALGSRPGDRWVGRHGDARDAQPQSEPNGHAFPGCHAGSGRRQQPHRARDARASGHPLTGALR